MSSKELQGTVITISGEKTVKVRTVSLVKHSRYHKYMKRHKNYLCHNELPSIAKGSVVKIVSSRPISKRKSWVVSECIS